MIVLFLICLLVEGFFSSAEMALVSINRSSLKNMIQKGSRRAQLIEKVIEAPEWLLGTTLLGTNLAMITLNTTATLYVIQTFGIQYEYMTALITAPLLLIFAEAIPKTIAQHYPETISLNAIYPIRFISKILYPFVAAIAGVANFVTKLSGVHSDKKTPFLTREEIEFAFKATDQERTIKDLEKKMIDRIFSFAGKKGRDIMISLIDIVSIKSDLSITDAEIVFQTSGYSRIPVYSERVDHVVGWINHYDLLKNEDKSLLVKDLMRKVYFMPINVELGKLLLKMQKLGESLTMLVDEYGGTVGMVTLEDVLEEIVGDIEDEYDFGSQLVKKVFKDRILVDAKIPLTKLEEIFGIKLPKIELDTLNGFLLEQFQDIPKTGETVTVGRFFFKVLKANDRKIEEVEIQL